MSDSSSRRRPGRRRRRRRRAAYARLRGSEVPPNLILISIDTLRASDLGAYGARPSPTPCLDAFAKEAVVFEQAYAQYPSTHLSAESLFSGRYPTATTLYRAMMGEPEGIETPDLPRALRARGLRGAASIAFTEDWLARPEFQKRLAPFELVNHARPGAPSSSGEHFTASAIASIDALGDQPFFIWLHYFDPHHPYRHHEGLTEGDSARERYLGELRFVDREFGRVWDHLKQRGLADNSVVVIASDHGEAFGEHGSARYHGTSLYEEQVRVPLIIRAPGIEASRRSELAENVDLFATLQGLMGLEPIPTQGASLLPLMLAGDAAVDGYPNFAYAELPGDVKESSVGKVLMLRDGSQKLLRFVSAGFSELYDLDEDPGEAEDLLLSSADVGRDVEARLASVRDWCRRFQRQETIEDLHEVWLADARSKFDGEDPFQRLSGLVLARERDLRELAPLLRTMLMSEDEFPELRHDALRLLALWRDREGMAHFSELIADAAAPPGLRAVALQETVALGRGVDIAAMSALVDGSADAGLRLEAMAAAVAAGENGPLRAQLLQTIASPRTGADWRRRALLSLARGLKNEEQAQELLARLDRLPDEFFHADDERILLGSLEAVSRSAWFRRLRRFIGNRYWDPRLKERVLTLAPALPEALLRPLAVELLAAWDPNFHAKAVAALSQRLSPSEIDAMMKGRAALDGLGARVREKEWAAAEAAAKKVGADLPAGSGQAELALARCHYALGRGDEVAAARNLGEASALAAAFELGGLAAEFAPLLRAVAELESYGPELGPLDERSEIRIRGLGIEPAELNFARAPGDLLSLEVDIENHSRRALLGGDWPCSGRLRVIWTAADGKEVYGTEVTLLRGLLPGERRSELFELELPQRPGHYRARIIVNQQGGSRFHWVEDEAACFEVSIRDPGALSTPRTFSALAIAGEWEAAPLMISRVVDTEACSYRVSGYAQRLTSPPLALEANSKLRIDYILHSTLPGADVLQLELIPLDGSAPQFIEKAGALNPAGEAASVALDLGQIEGHYRIAIGLGIRQSSASWRRIVIE